MEATTDYTPELTLGLLKPEKGSPGAALISTGINVSLLLLFILFGVQRLMVKTVRRPSPGGLSVDMRLLQPPITAPPTHGPPVRITPPPSPKLPAFRAPELSTTPRLPTIPVVVAVGTPKPPVTNPVPLPTVAVVQPPTVKVGSFGATSGLPAARSDIPHTAAAPVVGAFGTPSTAANDSPHGNAVKGTGFGSNSVANTTPKDRPEVASAGFSNSLVTSSLPKPVPAKPSVTLSPVVTYEPKPTYTADAKSRHVEGEVAVRVVFLADGTVQVLGLANSLDPGLDKEALNIAQKIKFKPAMRNSTPVDFATTIHIKFQLS